MSLRTRLLASLATAAVAAAALPAAADDYTFIAPEWLDVNWTVTSFGNGTVTGFQTDSTAGNPGFAREVVNDLGPGGILRGYHKWLLSSSIVRPQDIGPIARITMSLDGRYISGQGGNGQQVGVAIEQDGVAYYAATQPLGSTGDWVTLTWTVTGADFVRFDGNPGSPDFSGCGSPINLGFSTGNNGTAYNTRARYDNLSVTVTTLDNPIAETDFADSSWVTTSFGDGTVTSTQTASGNPGTARNVFNQLAGAGVVRGFHKLLDPLATVNPSVQGPIQSLTLSIDGRYISGVGGNGMQIGIGAEQGGVAFRAGQVALGSSGAWVNRQLTVTPADFSRLDGAAGSINLSATGGPVTFGFITSNSSGPYNVRAHFDNYSLTIDFAPRCPSDFNNNCISNSTDVSDFINQWFTDQADGTFLTDWDGNGVVNSTDVSSFINDWFVDQSNGCG